MPGIAPEYWSAVMRPEVPHRGQARTAMKSRPNIRAKYASETAVDPLDASTTTVVGDTSPEAIACATMFVAIRSLVQPLGSR